MSFNHRCIADYGSVSGKHVCVFSVRYRKVVSRSLHVILSACSQVVCMDHSGRICLLDCLEVMEKGNDLYRCAGADRSSLRVISHHFPAGRKEIPGAVGKHDALSHGDDPFCDDGVQHSSWREKIFPCRYRRVHCSHGTECFIHGFPLAISSVY